MARWGAYQRQGSLTLEFDTWFDTWSTALHIGAFAPVPEVGKQPIRDQDDLE